MQDLVNIMITTGVGLAILGTAYALDLLVGTIKVLFTKDMKWSWRKMGEDLVKAILIAIATEAWVVLWYVADWYAVKCGLDISSFTSAMSIAGMVGGITAGAFWYLASAGENLLNFLNTKHVVLPSTGDPDYAGIADKVKEITGGKSGKQLIEEAGGKLDGEDVTDQAGKGGIANTYPEPYKSAVKDTILDPSICWNRECVSYCSWKICELLGRWMPGVAGRMSAKYWIDRLPEWGFKEVAKPRNGGKYVGVTTVGQYGHCMWFEFDNTVSEYNYSSTGNFDVREVNLAQYRWYEIKAAPEPTPTPTPTKKVKYTYKQGDTFGQVICDLGLKTSHGLWGEDGDVAYYTEQLIAQGALDANGNVIVGRTIYLTPRVD